RQEYLQSEALLEQMEALSGKLSQEAALEADRQKLITDRINWASMFGVFLISFAFGIWMTRSITLPLRKGVEFAQKLRQGDLTAAIDVDQKDEVGILAAGLNEMAGDLRTIIADLVHNASSLNAAAGELSSISTQLTSDSETMNDRANTAAAATVEMSTSMLNMSASADQSTANANTVATATEEMTASVGEIAQNAEKARQVTTEAVASVDQAAQQIDDLGQAARGISKVIEVIVEIAEQTKLLALNATIEAARAGEAGKGFAVVANEVKELAKQTNDATEDIRQKIEAMQHSTDATVTEISQINRVIHDVEEIITSIATAVEEQAVTTQEIASNIGQAALGIQNVSGAVAEATNVAQSIAQDISSVNQVSGEVSAASGILTNQAQELARMGGHLQGLVGKFRI
ncbi:MAG: methyl-accepting chemotaxis protein, partial [Bacteroidota bacterium]